MGMDGDSKHDAVRPVARTVVVVDQYAFAGDISSSGRSPVFVGGRGSGAVGGGGRSR